MPWTKNYLAYILVNIFDNLYVSDGHLKVNNFNKNLEDSIILELKIMTKNNNNKSKIYNYFKYILFELSKL